MCAINPVHKTTVVFKVYTSEKCSRERFDEVVMDAALSAEIRLNSITRLRWHLTENQPRKKRKRKQ